ncbi:hypothetical protein M378DRAFT_432809 [Amanita muscaria Koide BX008]|uniref:3'-5' exonuclease domain-containing protein n=1 Tax=Amanita muscaria (strain Koide BX008) TaxID=946122 RepID=A0A0C2XBD7_AMAMK|nr:hypothetical protein M378DRAFT_432809 [Amanita muscaria Koide BX008]
MTTEHIVRTSSRSGPGASTTGTNARRKETPPKASEVSAGSSYSYKDYNPTPTVVYTRHEEEANELVASLKKGPLGFDMEWRVLWTRKANSAQSVAQDRRVAVVQLADTGGMILVIQVFAMSRFPKKLQEVIEDPRIPKLGANILNDGNKLLDDYGILAKNLLELGALVHMADPAGGEFLAGSRSPQWKNIIALGKLVAQYCQKTLEKPKHLRMGNWEAELNVAQVDYAASDAHCAVKIYDRLLDLANLNGIHLTNETIQKRCSSSVPHPCRKLSKLPSCSDVQMEESRPITGQVRRFATMPNMVTSTPVYASGSGTRPQHLRAYHLWYKEEMSLEQMCNKLRLNTNGNTGTVSLENSTAPGLSTGLEPLDDGDEDKQTMIAGSNSLKPSTVMCATFTASHELWCTELDRGYVIGALQTDAKLPFDMDKLRVLVQMDGSSWERHHDWLLRVWREGRGVAY